MHILKKHTSTKIAYYLCESTRQLIPELINIGIDAINPVQVSVKNMNS